MRSPVIGGAAIEHHGGEFTKIAHLYKYYMKASFDNAPAGLPCAVRGFVIDGAAIEHHGRVFVEWGASSSVFVSVFAFKIP